MPPLSLGPADYERALAAVGFNEVTVFHRQSTESTNDDARSVVASRLPSPETAAIVIAETQTKGRGRGANVWFSPMGSISLTITVPGVEVARLSVLPLGVGAAVVGALRDLGAAASVKWPNDVVIEGGKVCGILCESSLLSGTARVFVGIGINVEALEVEAGMAPHAATLAAHGVVVDRPALVADLTRRVLALIRGGATGAQIVADWKAVAVPWWGQEITFAEGDIEKRVTLLDVSPEGRLVVRDEGGVVRSFASGEVRQIRTART